MTIGSLVVFTTAAIATAQGTPATGPKIQAIAGDMELLSATGSGTETDPVTLIERFFSLTEARLHVDLNPAMDMHVPGGNPNAKKFFAFTKIVTNLSGRVWSGFRMEIQVRRNRPSNYYDGISFDQVGVFATRKPGSDMFGAVRLDMEPYDSVHFYNGAVNPGATVRLIFNIIDLNGVDDFYLVQQPEFLSSSL